MNNYKITKKKEAAVPVRDMRGDLGKLEVEISDLKIKYEQFFSGILQVPPEKSHQSVVLALRELHKAPFKNSALSFHLKTLENRYQSYNTYWQRILREREQGNYQRDKFKARLREANRDGELKKDLAPLKITDNLNNLPESGIKALYRAYSSAIASSEGRNRDLRSTNVDFDKFRTSVIKSAQSFLEKNPGKTVKFKVISQSGRVSITLQSSNS